MTRPAVAWASTCCCPGMIATAISNRRSTSANAMPMSAVPGYVDYGLSHGATLMVDIEDGRFAFFYVPVDL